MLTLCLTSIKANETDKKLNQLFNDLLLSNDTSSNEIEQKIWKLWSTHPDDKKLTVMLSQGSEAVNNNQLIKAIDIFTDVINQDPTWAEA